VIAAGRGAILASITVSMRNRADFDCPLQPLDVNRGVVDFVDAV